ncbi:MAG: hypothetical protein E6K72_08815 [Candidatus Eisenbacteria bacterium]|uniref:Uncharacterized protein n=1 Tax=Eiseniibacteriota bacterium TaxID=2212470 RepID=A0A538SNH6_UNCEI|nr:MAG: hypothetical protein E6K72_08815 [Candidatus Eisenbacteria bacterium]
MILRRERPQIRRLTYASLPRKGPPGPRPARPALLRTSRRAAARSSRRPGRAAGPRGEGRASRLSTPAARSAAGASR